MAQASRVVRFASARRVASLRMHEKMHGMQENDGRTQMPVKGEHLTQRVDAASSSQLPLRDVVVVVVVVVDVVVHDRRYGDLKTCDVM